MNDFLLFFVLESPLNFMCFNRDISGSPSHIFKDLKCNIIHTAPRNFCSSNICCNSFWLFYVKKIHCPECPSRSARPSFSLILRRWNKIQWLMSIELIRMRLNVFLYLSRIIYASLHMNTSFIWSCSVFQPVSHISRELKDNIINRLW